MVTDGRLVLGSSIYDRDIFVDSTSKAIGPPIVRGSFPAEQSLPDVKRPHIRAVPRGFANLTSLQVPEGVSILLSLGPKFMLPAYTLFCGEERKSMWEEMLYELERAGYSQIRRKFMHEELKKLYEEHVGDCHYVSQMDSYLLRLANETNTFLRSHSDTVSLVEGDKGKIFGLMYRPSFAALSDGFINAGVAKGQYCEFQVESESSFLDEVEAKYKVQVVGFCSSLYDKKYSNQKLFLPLPKKLSASVFSMNLYVRNTLTRVAWKVPVFRPTLKVHKKPHSIRPIISKRHTPSILVGKVIRTALGLIE